MSYTTRTYLGDLFRDYGKVIYSRVYFLLRDRSEANDVTQDTFISFMRIKGLPDSVASPLRVLNKIATCRAVDRLRSQARWTGVLGVLRLEEDDDSQEALESGPLYGGELNRVEVQHDLALLTKGESPQTLVMAFLHYVDGCTMEEIAALEGISRRTVSTFLHRFVERARKRSARFSGGGDA